jgi:serine protease Do
MCYFLRRPLMERRTKIIGTAVVFVIIGLIIGLIISSNLEIQIKSSAQTKEISKASMEFLDKMGNALSEISESVSPAIVNISTEKTVKMKDTPFDHFFNDPFFRRFFGDQPFGGQREYKSKALGSGVIVSNDGYILTNNHVVADSDEIKVLLLDNREFKGKVIGSDPKTDLAVIKISAKDLPVLRLGDSDKLKVGSVVIAVGNPYGLSHTITMGIVSAVGRANVGIADYEDFIQTDAAINPGNSGGALVNSHGELVGINTAIFSTTGGYQGIGFAIPSNMAKNVMESLIKHGKVVRGWLGVTIQDLTPDLAKHFGIKEEKGVLVSDVMEDSPAASAGMKRGDLIVQFNGKEVKDSYSLRNMVASIPPGTEVPVRVIRDGKEVGLRVKISELPEKLASARPESNTALEGVTVSDLTPEIIDKLGLPGNIKGVIITDIDENSPVRGVLAQNDIIQEINRNPIKNIKDFNAALEKAGKDSDILLLVNRGGRSMYLTLSK